MIYDFVIIGAGMAGASLAAELAPAGSVLMLEAEDFPGYHATGRSAAFWSETYGGPHIQPLTSASYDFLAAPPEAFSERSFLDRRGALHIANQVGHDNLTKLRADFAGSDVTLDPVPPAMLAEQCPGLRSDWNHAIWEPSCCDIDVGGLHQAYLRTARKSGAELRCSAPATAIDHSATGGWRICAGGEWFEAAIVINAAGAWADGIAAMAGASAVNITPYRRTVLQLRTDPIAPETLPLMIDAAGHFYFKDEGAGRIWLSPQDETPTVPGDAAPEEIDVARAIERFQNVVDWKVLAVEKKWAGLRSFSPDRLPVYGFDGKMPGFFWCAGQGGFGIQTAPAGARLCRSLLLSDAMPASLIAVQPGLYAPSRFA